MSMSHNAKRSWAFLASAAVGLSGIAATPALANQPAPTAQIVSEQAPAAASQSLQDASVDWGVKSSFRRYITCRRWFAGANRCYLQCGWFLSLHRR